MSIEKTNRSNTPMNVKAFDNADKKGLLRTDLAIQRMQVWKEEHKSLFIHSILYGFPVPPIFVQVTDNEDGDKTLWVLDGKQRITTLLAYFRNEFALGKDTPSVDGVEIAGKTFTELPEEFQDTIKDANILVYRFDNLSDEDRDEMFYRLNNGVALSRIERTRALAQGDIMGFVKEIASEPFFAESCAITPNSRNRFVDEEMILQIMMLITAGEAVSLSGTDVKNFVLKLKENGLSDKQKEQMLTTTQYLNKALPVREKWLKKVHVPILFVIAQKAIEQDVRPEQFGGWVKEFLTSYRPGDRYGAACSAGSAKRDNVAKRIEIMSANYVQNIASAPDYKTPEPKVNRGKGRPKKDQ
ncbi:MAG: GmrSD restriction endonuclease domain-containing protein [Peptococcales bacterium]